MLFLIELILFMLEFLLINYCNINNIKYNKVYQEIASGIDFDRDEFTNIINDVISKKIANIYIAGWRK